MKDKELIPIPRELLENLLDNTIECYAFTKSQYGTGRCEHILAQYQAEIDQVTELLGNSQ